MHHVRQESGNAVSFASAARPGSAQGKLSAANDVQCFRFLAEGSSTAMVVCALWHPEWSCS